MAFTQAAPFWVYLYAGFALFAYQTLDACDGKHARRTGMSSPVGQLFDHGCDALHCVLGVWTLSSCLLLGGLWDNYSYLILAVGAQLVFWFSTWEEYHTHVLFLPVINGPTEGLLLAQFLYIYTGLFGTDMWLQPAGDTLSILNNIEVLQPLAELQLNLLFVVVTAVLVVASCLGSIFNVFTKLRKEADKKRQLQRAGARGKNMKKKNDSKNDGNVSSVHRPLEAMSFVQACEQHLSLFLFYGLFLFWIYISPQQILLNAPYLVGFVLLFFSCLETMRMIVAYVTCSPYQGWWWLSLPLILCLANAHPEIIIDELDAGPMFDEYQFLWIMIMWVGGLYIYYVNEIFEELTYHLEIYMFICGHWKRPKRNVREKKDQNVLTKLF